ncbi:glycosyltransferase [Faecalicatena sp. Marseille-Q4148]|nr:glycosyltransferase [Faecalicatena sp. Marseille-Q4148]
MKILLLLSESWNDVTAPNNNMTNWFKGFSDVEIWTISGSSQMPNNQCSNHYFLIGENDMIKSLLTKERAGKYYQLVKGKTLEKETKRCDISDNKKIKKRFAGEPARLLRDFVWRYGKYDLENMKKFIQEFNPDIIFSQRRGSVKMCRLENTVTQFTNAPIVAYTGDDEYSLHQMSFSPFFWIRRFWTRKWLKKMIPQYKLFYSQSERQMEEFQKEFGVNTKFLVKCGVFDVEKIHKYVHNPIQVVYAGKLYCNRWKTLKLLADAIGKVNAEYDKTQIQLNIYTADDVTSIQNKYLNDGIHSIIHGRVSPELLPKIYEKSDIVLHIESFDKKNRLLTQDSFSTKVMDCLSSGCAVMAICWEGHAAFQYLKKADAAIIASSEEEIYLNIKKIVCNNEIICEYANKAYICGKNNHQKKDVQKMLFDDFNKVIEEC